MDTFNGDKMTLESEGSFAQATQGNTGIIYVPALLVADSAFPIKVGKVKIRIEGGKLIIEQA